MTKRIASGAAKSPVEPFAELLPGTTTDPVPGLVAPQGRWRERLRARISVLATAPGPITPYLQRAEERADAAIGEITQVAGYCGPIGVTQAVLGARFAELALFFTDHMDPTTKLGRKEVMLAKSCADASERNLNNALKTAHAIAQARRPPVADPLDAHMRPAEAAVDVEPSQEPSGGG